uniref:Dehydrogenase E1 component domain-containing protein n=1 Tax=Zea mays TaxID=4577 RepID=A0A804PPM2_MAIZE
MSPPPPPSSSPSSATCPSCAAWRSPPTPSIRPSSSAGSATSTTARRPSPSAWRPPSPAPIPSSPPTATTVPTLPEETATFALYGDGAANQGQLFEALNISALWKLPAILVCENNHYGMGTAEWRAAKSPAYYKRGDYVPGLKVDGMDVLAVKQACKFAKDHAVANGPIVLEMDTYRYHGHSMSDPGSTYRTRDEISGVRQERDPIERVRKLLLAHDLATAAELKDMEKEIRKQVDDAIAKAKESSMPDTSELFTNVYKKGFNVESFGPDRKELRATLP